MKRHSIRFSLLFVLLASIEINAQYSSTYTGAWSTTWNNPTSSLASVMIQGYINKKMLEKSVANQKAGKAGTSSGSTTGAARSSTSTVSTTPQVAAPDYTVLRFKPIANSGVIKQTAEALSNDPNERAQLATLFQEIKKSYEAEAAKGGKSNNIAAALTFFMTTTSMSYHQTSEPAENITDALVVILEEDMSASPAFKKMTSLEKQKMHDWLVVSGGFVLAGYLDAVQKNDDSQRRDYKQLADAFFKIVFGTSVEKFNLAAINSAPVSDLDASRPALSTRSSTSGFSSSF